MKKFLSGVLAVLMVVSIAAEAKSYSSGTRSSSFSAARSAPAKSNYAAPKQQAAPKAAGSSSNSGLKSLGFGKPASATTVSKPSVSASSKANPNITPKTTTTSSGWFSKKTTNVSSAPAYKAPQRKVVSPSAYKAKPRNVVVIQRNYYGGSSYGYNRNYGGGYYGNGYGYNSGGSGFGSSLMGAFAGMMIYDALTDNSAEKALQAQVNQLTATNTLLLNQNVAQAPAAAAKPQCWLPEDAPLMMSPSFYCQPAK